VAVGQAHQRQAIDDDGDGQRAEDDLVKLCAAAAGDEDPPKKMLMATFISRNTPMVWVVPPTVAMENRAPKPAISRTGQRQGSSSCSPVRRHSAPWSRFSDRAAVPADPGELKEIGHDDGNDQERGDAKTGGRDKEHAGRTYSTPMIVWI
jgi:hypothetical protein